MKDDGDVLVRIKRAVLQGRTRFSKKALLEHAVHIEQKKLNTSMCFRARTWMEYLSTLKASSCVREALKFFTF